MIKLLHECGSAKRTTTRLERLEVELADRFGIANAELSDLGLRWLEQDLRIRLIVDDELQIAWKNSAASSMLARRADIELRSGKLATVNRAQQAELERFVVESSANEGTWCLPKLDEDGHLIFTSQRLHWGDGGTQGIIIYNTGKGFRARYPDLGVAFGLTNSERKVITQLLEGKDADQIARAGGVSVETIRSHVRNIYGKLHVNSREGLFYRLRPYRIV